MKTLTIVSVILAAFVATLIMFAGCEGPAGPAGKDGTTSVINLEGFAPGIKCANCHNPDIDTTYYVWARRYQWERSKHAYGGDLERNGATCAGCHTTEGFIERWKNNWQTQVVGAKENPSPPGCFACHSPHSRGDFTRRDTAAVTIKSFIAGVSDATFNYGNGNICVRCHQTRVSSPMSPVPNPA
ncbi:MAG: hypothetical protein AAB393_10310, partial [Bacteroidota bacterium]